MATKKKSLYAESPIRGANVQEVNDTIANKLTGFEAPKQNEEEIEVIDGYESKEHFLDGIVPAGFTSTYGEEITEATDGQLGKIMEIARKVFDPADNFRFFISFLDNNRFTIVVPIKHSNMDDLTYSYMRVDARSVTLIAGNVQSQVEAHARRVAQHLKYRKTI